MRPIHAGHWVLFPGKNARTGPLKAKIKELKVIKVIKIGKVFFAVFNWPLNYVTADPFCMGRKSCQYSNIYFRTGI